MSENVLIVVLDALRFDRVGAFGGPEITPHIDEFAGKSVLFSNAYSTAVSTDPAVTSIQTGRYPLSHGIVNHGQRVTDDEKRAVENVPQLPDLFSKAGYRTAKFGRPLGRWHRNGFDIYPTSMESRMAFDVEESLGRRIKTELRSSLETIHPAIRDAATRGYRGSIKKVEKALRLQPAGEGIGDSRDDVLKEFEAFIEDSAPFYAFVHLMDTHAPYAANPELVSEYLGRFNYTVDVGDDEIKNKIPNEFPENLSDDQRVKEIKNKYYYGDVPSTAVVDAHYDATVTEMDARIGHLLSLLDEYKRYQNTHVVLLADHGESLNEHGIYYKHNGLYECTVHVPLLIRTPGAESRNVTDPVQITDIAPTVTSLTGVDGLSPDGFDLTPLVKRTGTSDRQVLMAEEAWAQRRRMILSDLWKLIYSVDGETICRICDIEHSPARELYDLESDPAELENVARHNESEVKRLLSEADRRASEYCDNRLEMTEDEIVSYDDEQEAIERLKALGYR